MTRSLEPTTFLYFEVVSKYIGQAKIATYYFREMPFFDIGRRNVTGFGERQKHPKMSSSEQMPQATNVGEMEGLGRRVN